MSKHAMILPALIMLASSSVVDASIRSDCERSLELWESGRSVEALDVLAEVRAAMLDAQSEALIEVLPTFDGMSRSVSCRVTSLSTTVSASYTDGTTSFDLLVYAPGTGQRADGMRAIIASYTEDAGPDAETVGGHPLVNDGSGHAFVVPLGGDRLLVNVSGNIDDDALRVRAAAIDWETLRRHFDID